MRHARRDLTSSPWWGRACLISAVGHDPAQVAASELHGAALRLADLNEAVGTRDLFKEAHLMNLRLHTPEILEIHTCRIHPYLGLTHGIMAWERSATVRQTCIAQRYKR